MIETEELYEEEVEKEDYIDSKSVDFEALSFPVSIGLGRMLRTGYLF